MSDRDYTAGWIDNHPARRGHSRARAWTQHLNSERLTSLLSGVLFVRPEFNGRVTEGAPEKSCVVSYGSLHRRGLPRGSAQKR